MTSLLVVVVTVMCSAVVLGNRYDLLADLYSRDLDDAGYLYGQDRGGVANRASQWYGDLLTQTRDQEYEPQIPALYGYKYMTGGAGEGKQHLTPSGSVDNKEQIKTDKVLPAYCNPPNPCPVGYTAAKDNCVENFDNTADHNRKYNAQLKCSCDAEHMYSCPDDKKTISAKVHGGDDDESATNLGDVINQLVDLESGDMAYFMDLADKGNDHATISKKSMNRRKRSIEMPEIFDNPYWKGLKKATAAKKSPEMARRSPAFL